MTEPAAGSARLRAVLTWCCYGYALLLPVTIVAGEQFGYLIALLGFILWRLTGKTGGTRSPYWWPIVIFVALAILSSALGLRPAISFSKLNRLLLVAVIFVVPFLGAAADAAASRFVTRLIALFLCGATAKALSDFVRIPLQLARETRAYSDMVAAGEVPKFLHQPTLFDMGNMRDPQFYMVALCIVIGLLLYRREGMRRGWLGLAGVVNAVAWVVHFKRGAWISLLLAVLIVALMSGRRWIILLVVLGAAALWPIPPVQHRLSQLRDEFQLKQGGRFALWTHAAPNMLREYPLGMGWRAPQHDDFTRYGVKVQRKLNHLHNNPLEVALETGWAGAVTWLVWMGTALVLMWRSYRWAREHDPSWAGAALGIFGGFVALMLNGLVEYNFGDAEIYTMMNLLMALSGFIWLLRSRSPTGPAVPSTPA